MQPAGVIVGIQCGGISADVSDALFLTGVLAFNSAASLASNSGARSLSGILILANPSLVIGGVNDTDEQAQELSKHARRYQRRST